MAVRVEVCVEAVPSVESGPTRRSIDGEALVVVTANRPNVLVEGTPAEVGAVLRELLGQAQTPVVRQSEGHGSPVDLPQLPQFPRQGTLVLEDVDRLSADQQAALHAWLESPQASTVQVVATATVALFSLVAQGCFDEALYYRLNTVLLRAQE